MENVGLVNTICSAQEKWFADRSGFCEGDSPLFSGNQHLDP